MSIFSRLFRTRDRPQNRVGSGFSFLFGGTASGKTVNERTAMQTTAVYACVRILAEAIAGLPLHLYRHRSDGGKERAGGHSLCYLLHDEPNPEMTSFVFRETLMSHLLLWGNAYAQVVRNGRGQVVALYPLLPNKMEVSRAASGQLIYTYSHRVAVLEEGMKFQAIGIPPEQAQFLETRKFQINEIARIFRIPPHMVGDLEKSSFSNIEQQSLEFVKYTLNPWVVRWEQALKQSLLLPSEKQTMFIKFNLDGLLRGDYQSRIRGTPPGGRTAGFRPMIYGN